VDRVSFAVVSVNVIMLQKGLLAVVVINALGVVIILLVAVVFLVPVLMVLVSIGVREAIKVVLMVIQREVVVGHQIVMR